MNKQPAMTLSYDPAGPKFPILENCEMPKITVTANLQNVIVDPKVTPQFHWKVTLVFNGHGCVHSRARLIKHPEIVQVTTTNKFLIPFTLVRGGELTVSVTVRVGPTTLTTQSQKLLVTGTNPSISTLSANVNTNQTFRKLMRFESELQQFLSDTCPKFSQDDCGGVGLCQLTNPAPTDDEVWNWKENAKAGWALYQRYQSEARAYPAWVRHNKLPELERAYHQQHLARVPAGQGPPPVGPATHPHARGHAAPMIRLPDFTSEQLERETLRRFNGAPAGLHEYRVKLDRNGIIVVTLDPNGTTGTAEWERPTVAQRIEVYNRHGIATKHQGDPDYVNHVESKAGF